MIIKRYIHSVRNKSLIISQILLPVIILLTNLLYIKYAIAEPDDSPALKIDLLSYDQNYIPFTINNLYPTNIDFNQSINSKRTELWNQHDDAIRMRGPCARGAHGGNCRALWRKGERLSGGPLAINGNNTA